MKIAMTPDQIRRDVASGNEIANLVGTYTSPTGQVKIEVLTDAEKIDFPELTMTDVASGKSMIVDSDRIAGLINAGILKIN